MRTAGGGLWLALLVPMPARSQPTTIACAGVFGQDSSHARLVAAFGPGRRSRM
jgi:hypothetical protein